MLTIYVNSLTFKLYLNLKENMEQKLTAHVTTVSVVYKTTVWTAQTRHEWGEKIRGTWQAHRANLLNWICHIRVSFSSVLMYKSCLWRKQNCRLSWMDTHSPELNCTATFIVSAWKNIPFFFKFHTAKQVKNFTHQINDNLNKNLLKKPHHNNVLGPDHFKSVGPSMNINQVSLLQSASRFPTTRRRNMFPWLRWYI